MRNRRLRRNRRRTGKGLRLRGLHPAGRLALQLTAAAFFLPPWLILAKAQAAGEKRHILLVRYLSLASIAGTCVLLALNIGSIGQGAAVGNALNAMLTVVSAPLVCSNFYAMPLFLWGTVVMGSFRRR